MKKYVVIISLLISGNLIPAFEIKLNSETFKEACKEGNFEKIKLHIESGLNPHKYIVNDPENNLDDFSPFDELIKNFKNDTLKEVLKLSVIEIPLSKNGMGEPHPIRTALIIPNHGALKLLLNHRSIIPKHDLLEEAVSWFVKFIDAAQAIAKKHNVPGNENIEKIYLPALYTLVKNLAPEVRIRSLNYGKDNKALFSDEKCFYEPTPVDDAYHKKLFLITRALMLLGADLTWKPINIGENNYIHIVHESVSENLMSKKDSLNEILKIMFREYQLINKKGKCLECSKETPFKCGACKIAHFCSKSCQKNYWKEHAELCTNTQKFHKLMNPEIS